MRVACGRCSRSLVVMLDYGPVHKRRTSTCIALLLLVGLLSSCAVTVSTPPITRVYPRDLSGRTRVLIAGFRSVESNCFQEEIEAYLAESKTFVPVRPPEGLNDRQLERFIEEQNVKLVLSGDVDKYQAGGDTTRNSTIGLLTAAVLTAPIALIYATATEWNGYAVASAKLTVVDTHTDETIWSLKDSVALNEYGKTLASEDSIKEALLPIACKNLVTKMLNDFAKNYAIYDKRR